MRVLILLYIALLMSCGTVYADITTGLLYHYSLDECSGTTAVDSVAANNMTLTDPTWVDGSGGGCGIQFNGTTTTGFSASNTGLSGLVTATISWRAKNITNGTMVSTGGAGDNHLFSGVCLGDGLYLNGYGIGSDLVTGVPCLDTSWAVYAIVLTGTNQMFYKNGVELGNMGRSSDLTDTPFSIGAQDGNSFILNSGAQIDEVRVYNRALSEADLAELNIPNTVAEMNSAELGNYTGG